MVSLWVRFVKIKHQLNITLLVSVRSNIKTYFCSSVCMFLAVENKVLLVFDFKHRYKFMYDVFCYHISLFCVCVVITCSLLNIFSI